MDFNLVVTEKELQIISSSLGKMSYEQVVSLIFKLQKQVEEQLNKKGKEGENDKL